MRKTSASADIDEESSLYDLIVDSTGIEFDRKEFPGGAEDYKNNLVRFFGKMDQDTFDAQAEDIRDWVNEATAVFNANRRAKERSPLPDIDGLPELAPEPPKASRRERIALSDDDEDDTPPAPPPGRTRTARAVPVPDDDEDEDEAPPAPKVVTAAKRTRSKTTPAVPAAPARHKRDPDSGRYAKVMPHYLKQRNIEVLELQEKIEKTDGAEYSEMTLERTLAACRSVVGWLERNGVDLADLS